MYQALVARIKTSRHPNADRLVCGDVLGYRVVTDTNTQDGELGLLFPSGGAVSVEFALANRLLRKHPETGAILGGYLNQNRKIDACKLRGVWSEALWLPLSCLDYLAAGYPAEGEHISEWSGQEICRKYISPQQQRLLTKQAAQKQGRTGFRWNFPTFREHYHTDQIRYNLGRIPEGAILYFTVKSHGCVHKDTEVETLELGNVRIEELVSKKKTVHIKSLNVTTNEIEYAPVEDWYFYPNDTDWYEIELENGKKITITGNNPVWLPELQTYRRVENLKIGNDLLVD